MHALFLHVVQQIASHSRAYGLRLLTLLSLCVANGWALAQTMPAMPGLPNAAPAAPAQGGVDLSRVVPIVSPEAVKASEHIQLRQFEQARTLINANLNLRPRSPQWRFLDALLCAESGNDQGAINGFESLVSEFPELAEPYNNLAVLYLRNNEPQRAREALERAIANRPRYIQAYENLGDLYVQLALQSYEAGIAIDKRSPFLGAKRDHLKALPQPAPLRIQSRPRITEPQ